MELDMTKMSELDLMKCSSMEEYTPKQSYFIKKNNSSNDVSRLNFNRGLKANLNKTTYQPYIPNYPKISNLHISSSNNDLNGTSGTFSRGRDLGRLDLGKTLNNFEFSPTGHIFSKDLDNNYSDKYNNALKSCYKDNVYGTFSAGSGNYSGHRDNDVAEPANGDPRNGKSPKTESEHVCLSGKDLEEFRTRQCPLYSKGMCLNSSKCSLSHSETWPRRNPVLFKYDYKLCPNIQFSRHDNKMQLHGKCSFGRRCRFSHSKEEQLYHPELYKTRYCLNFPNCKGYYCPFAHSKEELRNFQPTNNGNSKQNEGNSGANTTLTISRNGSNNGSHNSNGALESGNNNSNTNYNNTNPRFTSNNYNVNNANHSNANHNSNGLNGTLNANNGGALSGVRVKQRAQRDIRSFSKSRNELASANYSTIEEEESIISHKSRNEEVLNTTTSPYKTRDADESFLKIHDDWNTKHRGKDEWNVGFRGKNDDILSNTTSAYSNYNVDDLDIELSSTYDTLSHRNNNCAQNHRNYNNHKLFKEDFEGALNHGIANDNQRSPRTVSDTPYSPSSSDRDDPVSDKHEDEEDDNWFESLIKNGLDSLEDNQQTVNKSWLNEDDLHEIFNNLRDCSVDNNCPFCSIKRDYKFTDSEQMLKLSEDVFKPWSNT